MLACEDVGRAPEYSRCNTVSRPCTATRKRRVCASALRTEALWLDAATSGDRRLWGASDFGCNPRPRSALAVPQIPVWNEGYNEEGLFGQLAASRLL